MTKQTQMTYHLLIRKFVTFRHLNHTVQHQHTTITHRVKHQDVLHLLFHPFLYLIF